jgi:hypothetical protein
LKTASEVLYRIPEQHIANVWNQYVREIGPADNTFVTTLRPVAQTLDASHEFYNHTKGCDEVAIFVTNVTEILSFDMS